MSDSPKQAKRAQPRKWITLLHIYVSLYAFLMILFFGVSGFMMNHPEWFGMNEVSIRTMDAQLPVELCQSKDRLGIVEYLRSEIRLRGLVQECDLTGEEYRIAFRSAGERADVSIDAATGKARIDLESHGMAAIMGAIHAGEHTGQLGKRVVDVAAIFLVLTALTGIVLWASLSIRRETGILWLAASAILILVVLLKLAI